MDVLLVLISLAIVLSVLAAVFWWYYPYVRKPWVPKLGQVHGAVAPRPNVKNPSLLIHKARREMELYDGDMLIRTYRVALGLNPVDDKRKEGDGCTPEGEFYICTRNDRSKFHLFLGLSYPNEGDAQRGLKNGLISQEQYARIREALAARKRPPWDTPLGGEIGIHGEGSKVDWTQGGIAMENSDIEKLFMIVEIGTPVTILP